MGSCPPPNGLSMFQERRGCLAPLAGQQGHIQFADRSKTQRKETVAVDDPDTSTGIQIAAKRTRSRLGLKFQFSEVLRT